MNAVILIVACVCVVMVGACSRAVPPQKSKKVAETIAERVTTPEQARLWRAVSQESSVDLAVAGIPRQPVENRRRASVPNRGTTPHAVTYPPEVRGALRVLAVPQVKGGQFVGAGKVIQTRGERIDLDLGQNRTLALQVRVHGTAMRARSGDIATVEYRAQDDAFDRHQVIAVKVPSGDGIVSILEGGRGPVSVRVPLFDLRAQQVGDVEKGQMRVDVRVGASQRTMASGQVAQFPGLTVGVLASSAYVGPDSYRAEGNPYSMDLIAWRVPSK
jgi:hypothetical protein